MTEAFFFECFGPFLALNVSFRDDRGTLREGRTRFLFGIRDLEAWQNIPLEIAYRGADERVILIGGAPGKKIGEKIPKREKGGTKTLAKGKKIVYNKP